MNIFLKSKSLKSKSWIGPIALSVLVLSECSFAGGGRAAVKWLTRMVCAPRPQFLTPGRANPRVAVLDQFVTQEGFDLHGELVAEVVESPLQACEVAHLTPSLPQAPLSADRVHVFADLLDDGTMPNHWSRAPQPDFSYDRYGDLFVPVLERACLRLKATTKQVELFKSDHVLLNLVFNEACQVRSLPVAVERTEDLLSLREFQRELVTAIFQLGLEALPESAKVVVASFELLDWPRIRLLEDFIQNHPHTIVVVSAGNEGLNLSQNKRLRACDFLERIMEYPNVVIVAATDQFLGGPQSSEAKMAHYSNHGLPVHLAAPGGYYAGLFRSFHGTSFAAPAVARALGLIDRVAPNATAEDKIEVVKRTVFVPNCPLIQGATSWGGVLDVPAALEESRVKLRH